MKQYIPNCLLQFSFYQNTFAVLTWLVVPSGFLFLPNVLEFFRIADKNNIEIAQLSDIKLVIASALFQMCLSLLVKKTMSRFAYANLDEKYQGEERLLRVDKITKMIYDNVFYTTSTVFAYYTFSNAFIIPKWLFGQGECGQLFQGYPNKPNIPYFNEFYLYQLGNHLYRLVHHVVEFRQDARFYEMFLHHYAAFLLIFYSYCFNYTAMGSIILVLHDIGDIFFSVARAYDSMKNKVKAVWYLLVGTMLVSWIYTRLVVLPGCLMKACYDHHDHVMVEGIWEHTRFAFIWMESLLVILVVLHIYWTGTFISIGAKSVSKGTVRLSANPKRQKHIDSSKDD